MPENTSNVVTTLHTASCGLLGQIHLNRPHTLNVLNHPMIQEITHALKTWADNKAVKAVCITGEGRAFCAGGDIKALYHNGPEQIDPSMAFFKDEYALNQLIFDYPKPYIALMQSITMGGGVGLSIPGRYKIACDNLKLAMPETSIGLFPDVGALYFLSRLPDNIGLYYALTGETMDASTAHHFGLVDYIISTDTQSTMLESLITLPDLDETTLSGYFQKVHIDKQKKTIAEKISPLESHNNLNELFSALENDASEPGQELLARLNTKSPFSLSVTLDAYQSAIDQPFHTVLKQNLVAVKRCLSHPDLYEGIRALLIDKDLQPNWEK